MATTDGKLGLFGGLIAKIAFQRGRMSREEAQAAYRQVILNLQPELQQGAFLLAHMARGPVNEELLGALDAIEEHDALKISCGKAGPVCDIGGTGADALKAINCSMPASLIAASCGLNVAKKGAKNCIGGTGSIDIIEELGIDVGTSLEAAMLCLDKYGYCLMPNEIFIKSVWPRLIGNMNFITAFNLVGPLTKPCADTSSIVVGSYSPQICSMLIEVAKEVGYKSAIAAYGMADESEIEDGMDEISPCGETLIVELLPDGKTSSYEIAPSDFGAKPCRLEEILESDAKNDAARILDVLKCGKAESPEGRFFCINASAMLKIAGIAPDFKVGYEMAAQALAKGLAYEKLQQFKSIQGRK